MRAYSLIALPVSLLLFSVGACSTSNPSETSINGVLQSTSAGKADSVASVNVRWILDDAVLAGQVNGTNEESVSYTSSSTNLTFTASPWSFSTSNPDPLSGATWLPSQPLTISVRTEPDQANQGRAIILSNLSSVITPISCSGGQLQFQSLTIDLTGKTLTADSTQFNFSDCGVADDATTFEVFPFPTQGLTSDTGTIALEVLASVPSSN
jgi:hypothetical protein